MSNKNNGLKLSGEGSHDGRMHASSVRFSGQDYHGVNGQIVPNAIENIMNNLESLKRTAPEYQALRFNGKNLVFRLGDNPKEFAASNDPNSIFGLAQIVEDDARKEGFGVYEAGILASDIIQICGLKEASYWVYLEQHEKTTEHLKNFISRPRRDFVPKLVG